VEGVVGLLVDGQLSGFGLLARRITMGSKTLSTLVAAMVALTVTGACSDDGGDEQAAVNVTPGGETGAASGQPEGVAPDGPYVRTMGLPLEDGRIAPTEFEIIAIERTEDTTALYMSFTVTEDAPTDGRAAKIVNPPVLVDPLSGRAYAALVDDPSNPDPNFYHSVEESSIPLDGEFGRPNDHFAVRLYYPSLPADVETVTVAFSHMGFMTGIPVHTVNAHRPPTDLAREAGPEAGREPDGSAQEVVVDLLGFVETPNAATERAGDTEIIVLRSDVLFEFDDASLGPDARAVLAETAAAIRANGAPGTGITVEGHTDGIGDAVYNQDLSLRRANAVRDELTRLLGDGDSFDVTGRGSTEPVTTEGGPDDEQARARNRRVEISYTVDARADTQDDATEAAIDVAERYTADPAPYRPAGEPVATRNAGGWQLDVYPLVRDGAYLMTELRFTNGSGATAAPGLASAGDEPVPDRYRSNLGNFRLLEPSTGLVRYVAGFESLSGSGYDPASTSVREVAPGASYVALAIYPAPSLDTDQLTLQAGPFGEIPDLPIQ
jgi:OOP family OmpA-OmpF porin